MLCDLLYTMRFVMISLIQSFAVGLSLLCLNIVCSFESTDQSLDDVLIVQPVKTLGYSMSKNVSDLVLTASKNVPFSTKEYAYTLADIKPRIKQAQIKAVLAANAEMTRMYWEMGKLIVERQEGSGWRTKFIELLAKDLQNEFPGMEGFSRTNLFRMRAFYLANRVAIAPDGQSQELSIFFHLPWTYNIILLEKVKDTEQRLWYAQQAIEHGWCRNTLDTYIDADLYHCEDKEHFEPKKRPSNKTTRRKKK